MEAARPASSVAGCRASVGATPDWRSFEVGVVPATNGIPPPAGDLSRSMVAHRSGPRTVPRWHAPRPQGNGVRERWPSECEMVAQAPEHHLTRAHDSAKDGVGSRRRESTLATRRPTFARSGLATPPGRITSAARLPGRGRPCVIRMYRGRIDGTAAGGGRGERHERAFAEACGARGGLKARRTRLGGEGDNAAAPGAVGRHRALRRDRRPSGRGNTRP